MVAIAIDMATKPLRPVRSIPAIVGFWLLRNKPQTGAPPQPQARPGSLWRPPASVPAMTNWVLVVAYVVLMGLILVGGHRLLRAARSRPVARKYPQALFWPTVILLLAAVLASTWLLRDASEVIIRVVIVGAALLVLVQLRRYGGSS
jgi:hypothetical protein